MSVRTLPKAAYVSTAVLRGIVLPKVWTMIVDKYKTADDIANYILWLLQRFYTEHISFSRVYVHPALDAAGFIAINSAAPTINNDDVSHEEVLPGKFAGLRTESTALCEPHPDLSYINFVSVDARTILGRPFDPAHLTDRDLKNIWNNEMRIPRSRIVSLRVDKWDPSKTAREAFKEMVWSLFGEIVTIIERNEPKAPPAATASAPPAATASAPPAATASAPPAATASAPQPWAPVTIFLYFSCPQWALWFLRYIDVSGGMLGGMTVMQRVCVEDPDAGVAVAELHPGPELARVNPFEGLDY
eukprot:TRINITY_DN12795_c0_g1_i1.p1 TRINITY_DN12795_c0_g1~~TRINITY_DN12795_c0_g1_i1.p1  ORF type:complete len:302 (+),score=48.47 TRINITY_DN12795_c0_g1_i1:325-1230(+)